MLPFVFEDGMGFERYVDYALDVPMYFVYRDGKYIDVAGKSFRDFLAHKIPEVAHITPAMSDWADHLTTIFPEVRLKSFLEMRGTDGGMWRRICGMPALWVGLLYDSVALDACWDLVKDWTAEERQAMRDGVGKQGFKTPFRKATVHELAHRMLEISSAGLKRRAALDGAGMNEDGFLNPVRELVNRGYTRAEEMLKNYYGVWGRDLSHLFSEYDFASLISLRAGLPLANNPLAPLERPSCGTRFPAGKCRHGDDGSPPAVSFRAASPARGARFGRAGTRSRPMARYGDMREKPVLKLILDGYRIQLTQNQMTLSSWMPTDPACPICITRQKDGTAASFGGSAVIQVARLDPV